MILRDILVANYEDLQKHVQNAEKQLAEIKAKIIVSDVSGNVIVHNVPGISSGLQLRGDLRDYISACNTLRENFFMTDKHLVQIKLYPRCAFPCDHSNQIRLLTFNRSFFHQIFKHRLKNQSSVTVFLHSRTSGPIRKLPSVIGSLWMRHQTKHGSRRITDACNVMEGSIRIHGISSAGELSICVAISENQLVSIVQSLQRLLLSSFCEE